MESTANQAEVTHLPFPKRILAAIPRFISGLLYHQFAWTYDGVACIVSAGAWQSWVLATLPFLDGPRVLEIGFGPGHLLLAMQRKGIMVFGLDESPQMVQLSRTRVTGSPRPPQLMRGLAEALPFVAESLHQVVMTFPAEFILKETSLAEVRRVLVRGGKAIILPVAWITGRKPWERLAAWLNRVTGQAPAWDERYLEPMKRLGFDATSHMVDLPGSRLLILQLIKPYKDNQD